MYLSNENLLGRLTHKHHRELDEVGVTFLFAEDFLYELRTDPKSVSVPKPLKIKEILINDMWTGIPEMTPVKRSRKRKVK